MISFERDGEKVAVWVDTGLKVKAHYYNFERPMPSELSAEIVVRHLRGRFWKLIEQARREAYECGYQDGRNHGKKVQHFCTSLHEC